MKRVDDIIGLWPSMADLGRDLDVPYSTVAAWKQRSSIPVSYWRELVRAAQQRRYREVTADLLIEAHDQAANDRLPAGFAEEAPPASAKTQNPVPPRENAGQFTRWKPLRRTHFAKNEEIVEHVSALRDEWNRR